MLGLGLGLNRILIQSGGNVVDGALVLFNDDDGLWYSSSPDGELLSPPEVAATPSRATHTVTVPSDDDSTTHVIGVANDPTGVPEIYMDQSDSGGAGETIMLGALQLKAKLNPSLEYIPFLV